MKYIQYTLRNANKPGHNEFGVPLCACWGHRHDAHYWAYKAQK